jgi:hypothetical protein
VSANPIEPAHRAFVTPQRERLAESVRHLIDSVLTIEDATEEQLGTAADAIEGAAAHLGRPHVVAESGRAMRNRAEMSHGDYLPRSPVVGDVSPREHPMSTLVNAGRCWGRGRTHAP